MNKTKEVNTTDTRLTFKNLEPETQEACVKEVSSEILLKEIVNRITMYEEQIKGFEKVLDWGKNAKM